MAPASGRAGAPSGGPAGVRPTGPAGTGPANRSDATRPSTTERLSTMARGFIALFLEVEAGRRPRTHLTPFLSPMLYARLTNVWVRTGAPGRVLLVRVVSLALGECDVVAVVRRGRRCGAVSLRMVRTPAGWVVDDIALPEFGPLPPPPYPVPAGEPDDCDDLAPIALPVRDPAAARGPRADWFRPPITG